MSERPLGRIAARIANNNTHIFNTGRTGTSIGELLHRLDHDVQTAKDVLDLTPLELQKLLDIPLWEAKELLEMVSIETAPKIHTLLRLQQSDSLCNRTGIRELDSALRGGLRSGHIHEIVGRAGAGKTQFCLTLAVVVASTGRGVIYIDTENKFSAERIVEIASSRKFLMSVEEIAKRVIVIKPSNSKQVLKQLQGMEAVIISNKVGLVLVDSIAALVRLDYSTRSRIVARQRMLSKQASQLKYLANAFSIPILVTNQVSSFDGAVSLKTAEGVSLECTSSEPSYAMFNPALGNTWAHCVNVRILLEVISEQQTTRRLRIVKSPSCAAKTVYVDLTISGIIGTNENSALRQDQYFLNSLSKEELDDILS
uniref:RecA family profile 1 domain-containing protein n=1 Tax=Aplanochytrium stocchinoi TaxID=215587 RepID=A0A7S3PN31_9STRA